MALGARTSAAHTRSSPERDVEKARCIRDIFHLASSVKAASSSGRSMLQRIIVGYDDRSASREALAYPLAPAAQAEVLTAAVTPRDPWALDIQPYSRRRGAHAPWSASSVPATGCPPGVRSRRRWSSPRLPRARSAPPRARVRTGPRRGRLLRARRRRAGDAGQHGRAAAPRVTLLGRGRPRRLRTARGESAAPRGCRRRRVARVTRGARAGRFYRGRAGSGGCASWGSRYRLPWVPPTGPRHWSSRPPGRGRRPRGTPRSW